MLLMMPTWDTGAEAELLRSRRRRPPTSILARRRPQKFEVGLGPRARWRLAQVEREPCLPLVCTPPSLLLAEVRREKFPDLQCAVGLYFGDIATLAWIRSSRAKDRACVFIHELINRRDTPEPVLRFIITHELLHLRIRPREINGVLVTHPPEFSDAEQALAPERSHCWAWLLSCFGRYLVADREREQTRVKRTWKESRMCPMPTWDEVGEGD